MSVNYESERNRDLLCDQFEQAWQKNPKLRIETFVANQNSKLNDATLNELILLEIDLLKSKGLDLSIESYSKRFPDHVNIVDEGFKRIKDLEQTLVVRSTINHHGSKPKNFRWTKANKIPERVGQFEILRQLGRGAFGVVYKARDVDSKELFAIKFPRKKTLGSIDELLQLQNEVELAANLDHPAIVKSYGMQEEDEFVFNVQQFINGSTLSDIEPTDHSQAIRWLAEVAEGLAYAHEKGLVHRDLKPSNIMIDANGQALVADFGLAVHESAQRRLKGQRCGSPPYMSPEQVMGLTHQMDGRSDIWSLGVVMYELLAGRRPFDGENVDEVYEEIKSRNEKPLCMVNPDLDHELQRICLKCLAKPIRDRYHTAELLADDLRNWLKYEDQWKSKSHVPLIPRGLRSFGAQDAEAYLQLLPGQRDRHGIPDSINFWKHKIESGDASSRFSVGVIIGPSGSGKSSFMKAGLLPRLDSNLVQTVYIESSADHTEDYLRSALLDLDSNIPRNTNLEQIADGIKNEVWFQNRKNVVIVLDQFEQWLSSRQEYGSTDLAQALRHCDGKQLFCILLVRDDFWFSASQLCEAVGTNWNENENVQRIDLFDLNHGQDVLYQFGRAMGKLPANKSELKKPQSQFLSTAVSELSQNEKIISVHLTTFAEMFKNRDWDMSELQNVGGVKGVGQQFLESHFGTETKGAVTKKISEAILEQLLPRDRSGIRGAAKPISVLEQHGSSDGTPREFKAALNFLERDLKLVAIAENEASDSEPHYQLTHDYLVVSIRDWLSSELQKSRSGRAKLRLRELVSLNPRGAKPNVLPTNSEWLAWQFLLPNSKFSPVEQRLFKAGRRQFIGWSARAIIATILFVSFAFFVFRWQRGSQLVENLMGMKFENVPAIVEELRNYKQIVSPKLKQITSNTDSTSLQIRRACLGLHAIGEVKAPAVLQNMLRPECTYAEYNASHQVLRQNVGLNDALSNQLTTTLKDRDEELPIRLRAAALIANERKQYSKILSEYADIVFSGIANEPAPDRNGWVSTFKPAAVALRAKLGPTLANTNDKNLIPVLVDGVTVFSNPSESSITFSNLLRDCSDDKFAAIHNRITEKLKSPLIDEIELVLQNESIAKSRANLLISLLKLGRPQAFLSCLADREQAMTRSYAIVNSTRQRINFETVKSLYGNRNASAEVQCGLLMILAQQAVDLTIKERIEWLEKESREVYLKTPHPNCFSTAELIIRRLGNDDIYALRKRRVEENDNNGQLGNVFIDKRMIAFAIVEPNKTNGLDHSIAVSINELTQVEYLGHENVAPANRNLPYVVTSLPKVIAFCNKMNLEDGIEKADWPMPNATTEEELHGLRIRTESPGYRLMTHEEWFAICKATNGIEFLGYENELAHLYATTFGNTTGGALLPVGNWLPNELGLFDWFGNAYELAVKNEIIKPERNRFIVVGSDSRQSHSLYSTQTFHNLHANQPGPLRPGLRLIMTLLK